MEVDFEICSLDVYVYVVYLILLVVEMILMTAIQL